MRDGGREVLKGRAEVLVARIAPARTPPRSGEGAGLDLTGFGPGFRGRVLDRLRGPEVFGNGVAGACGHQTAGLEFSGYSTVASGGFGERPFEVFEVLGRRGGGSSHCRRTNEVTGSSFCNTSNG